MTERLSIVTFNARGLIRREKRRAVFRHMRIKYKNCIIIMQETHSKPDVEACWKSEWSGEIFFSHDLDSGQNGVAILFPPDFSQKTSAVYINDSHGRIVCAQVENVGDPDPLFLMGVYGPAIDNQSKKCEFLDCVREILSCYSSHNIILVGDFNIRLGWQDSSNDRFTVTRASKKLNDILDEFILDDSWRIHHPGTRQYTWRRRNPLQQSRIDYVFVSRHLLQNNVVKSKIETGIMSDHSIVFFDMHFSTQGRGPGTWIYNNSLLENDAHVLEIRAEIKEAVQCRGIYAGINTNGLKLEMLLSSIRVLAIKRSKAIAGDRRREESLLFQKANDLEAKLADKPSSEEMDQYENVKLALDELKERRGKAAILRSHTVWMEEGEKSTRYFLRLAKTRAVQKAITTLQLENGDIIRGNEAILDACVSYYTTLYSSKFRANRSFSNFSLDREAPRLSEQQKLSCEGPITKSECKEAISKMARNKTAGISGFTAEFFDYFWEDIGDMIVYYFNRAREEGELFISHRRGILTLIPKKGNQMLLKNKRPICLLDVIYKIAAKVISVRLEKVIHSIIHRSQTGFMKCRYIGENIRLISDVIEYCKIDNSGGLLFAIDYRNAFDSLEHDFIIYALESFNFGSNFISWIRLLYRNALLTVKNNGFTSSWFPCSRGTFQGSPLSGLLFNLAVEMLALKVRSTTNIKGIEINGQEIKMTQYADDTTLFLSDTSSVQSAIEMLADFKSASGLDINLSKCSVMWLGSLCQRQDGVCGIESRRKVKILGVWFSAVESCNDDNIKPVLNKVTKSINSWQQRSLTIKGRIVVAKALLVSQLVFLASCVPIEKVDLREIQSHIMKFIWRGRPPKVARGTLCQGIKQGGLNAVDVETFFAALQLNWIRRMFIDTEAIWRKILQHRLGEFKLNDLIRIKKCNMSLKGLKIPAFYKDLIDGFHRKCCKPSDDVLAIRTQSLWHNDDILIGGKTVFFKDMYSAGIRLVDDIINKEGKIMNDNEIRNKYPALQTSFMAILSLLSAIPRTWKSALRGRIVTELSQQDRFGLSLKVDEKIISIEQVQNRHFCQLLTEVKIPAAIARWAHYGIRPRSWQNVFEIPYMCTTSTRLQSLHYRIINRFIPTRRYLSIRGVVGSQLCRRCFQVDDLKHFFFDCEDVKQIWTATFNWLREVLDVSPACNEYQSVILGLPESPPIVNLIILVIKQHIVSCKLSTVAATREPQITCIEAELEKFARSELIIASKKNKIDQYRKKWQAVIDESGKITMKSTRRTCSEVGGRMAEGGMV